MKKAIRLFLRFIVELLVIAGTWFLTNKIHALIPSRFWSHLFFFGIGLAGVVGLIFIIRHIRRKEFLIAGAIAVFCLCAGGYLLWLRDAMRGLAKVAS